MQRRTTLQMTADNLPFDIWEHVFLCLPPLDMAGLNGASVMARQYATLAKVSRHFNGLVQPCWDRLADDVGEMIAACDLRAFIEARDHLPAWHNFFERMQLQQYDMVHLACDHHGPECRKCPGLPTLGRPRILLLAACQTSVGMPCTALGRSSSEVTCLLPA